MMEYLPTRISDLMRDVNRRLFLPAIQRELTWGKERIERLFDSVMADFPIGTFLFWLLEQEQKYRWPVYRFIENYNREAPHNPPASLSGITRDINLVLDGQQRIAALYIGLLGRFRYRHYRWRETQLYLNLLKPPSRNEENPEEPMYGFLLREDDTSDGGDPQPQLWYRVGRILDFAEPVNARADIQQQLEGLPRDQQDNAYGLIDRLHSRIHTLTVAHFYQERSQDPEKVLQVFIRANTAGKPLEYSDLLLATATAQWETLNAREEVHDFTDELNELGNGYSFGKDFVLKSCLFLSELPVQYLVRNFTRENSHIIEGNWSKIKDALRATVRLVARFGFHDKNIVAPSALLPIAYYVMKRGNRSFDMSSDKEDADAQVAIRRWFVFSTLKNAFRASTDTTLTRLRELLVGCNRSSPFPDDLLYKSLGIEPRLSEEEIETYLGHKYRGRYTNLVLSLLYPDRDWKDAAYHEDHVFPKREFELKRLKARHYERTRIDSYVQKRDLLPNLQLLTESENLSKNAKPFDEWIQTRDAAFRQRHLIPDLPSLGFDAFDEFFSARKQLIAEAMKAL